MPEDDDPPGLAPGVVQELHALCVGLMLPGETESERGRGPHPNRRGARFFGRYAGGVGWEDVEAFGAYVTEVLGRRRDLAERFRAEGAGRALAPHEARALAGTVGALEAGTDRGERLLAGFLADARAGMAAARAGRRHP